MFLDQEKAFDRVYRQFLLKTLKHLNFGDNFISWIEIILKDISSQIKINGFLSDYILIARGVRQGDPLSALPYVIIAQVLGNKILMESLLTVQNKKSYNTQTIPKS